MDMNDINMINMAFTMEFLLVLYGIILSQYGTIVLIMGMCKKAGFYPSSGHLNR